jgi:hypothetical protein
MIEEITYSENTKTVKGIPKEPICVKLLGRQIFSSVRKLDFKQDEHRTDFSFAVLR